jgi:hypothetical protein
MGNEKWIDLTDLTGATVSVRVDAINALSEDTAPGTELKTQLHLVGCGIWVCESRAEILFKIRY